MWHTISMGKLETVDRVTPDSKKDAPSKKQRTWYDEWDRATKERDTGKRERDDKRGDLQKTQKELSRFAGLPKKEEYQQQKIV